VENESITLVSGVASPTSTGGAGTDFERRVGAYYLAETLFGAIPRGMKSGITREVRFQRLYQGEPLDDLIIISSLPSAEAKLALQLKRDLTFGDKDETFDEVMKACWQTFASTAFDNSIDRFGVGLALYSRKIDEYYQSVLAWARSSATAADFLERVSTRHLSNESQRSFLARVRRKLDKHAGRPVTDDEIWSFLGCMVILRFDLSIEGSADYAHAIQIVESLLSVEHRALATALFDKLEDYAAEANQMAGSLNENVLRQRLITDGFPLLPAPDCRADLSRLEEHGALILASIADDIGGLTLNRSDVVAQAAKALGESRLIELIGPPGNGKSAILKAVAENQEGQGPLFLLSWERLEGAGWDSFASRLQLQRPLREIMLAASGSANPCLFIDGPDRIVSLGSRQIVKDILHIMGQMPTCPDGSRRWRVVLSAREDNLQELHSWLYPHLNDQPQTVRVPELTLEELKLVASNHPRLQPLVAQARLTPVLRNPFMLNLLSDPRMISGVGDPSSSVATESEVQGIWWERLVGNDAEENVDGRSRQLTLLKLGRADVPMPGQPLIIQEADGRILRSLERDHILVRDPSRDVYRFGHDLLEDWVLFRVLNQRREELTQFIRELSQPYGLFSAVQLLGCFILESSDDASEWLRLLEQFERAEDFSPRWWQALLTAPLSSTRARELLQKVEPILFAEEGRRLIDLLVTLRTLEVNPDYNLLPYLDAETKERGDFMAVLMSRPLPRWRPWMALLGWLLDRVDRLPPAVRPEATKVMEIWQKRSPAGAKYRREIAHVAFSWLQEIEKS
jgi:hypothetical protein